jgi:hypothetical protein
MQAAYATTSSRSRRKPLSKAAFTFRLLHIVNAVCMLAQLVISFSYDNIISATTIFCSTGFLLTYLRATDACQTRLISSFMLFGFCMTTQFGALLGQTLSWEPVAGGLRVPIETFGHLAGLQLVAILAHCTFRYIKPVHGVADSIAQRVLSPMGLFIIPSPGNLWLLGVIGFLAQTAGASATGNMLGKAVDGLRGLAWAPFLIPVFHARFGNIYCAQKKQYVAIAAYFSAMMLLGMALNFRGVMLIGATTAAAVFLMSLLQDEQPIKPGILLKLIAAGIVMSILVGAFGDLAKAMLIVRGQRGQATPIEMVTKTFELIIDRTQIDGMTSEANLDPLLGLYDEQYLVSPILSRLVETKFHDNGLFFGSLLTQSTLENLMETTGDQLLVILPEPLLKALKIDIKKDELFFSMGDYIGNLAYGLPLGGFKTGSALAQGITLFGLLFYPIYFFIAITLMIISESQCIRGKGGQTEISAAVMLTALALFARGLTSESLNNFVNVLRVVPQGILTFALMYWISRYIFKPFVPR